LLEVALAIEIQFADRASSEIWILFYKDASSAVWNVEALSEKCRAHTRQKSCKRRLVTGAQPPEDFSRRAFVGHYTETIRSGFYRHDDGIGGRDQRRSVMNEDLPGGNSEVDALSPVDFAERLRCDEGNAGVLRVMGMRRPSPRLSG